MMMRMRRRRTTTANHSRRKTFFLIFSLFLHFFVLIILAPSLSFLISFNFFNLLLLIHRLLARFVLHDYFIVHLLTNLTVRQEVRQSHVLDVVAWGPCTRIPAKSLRDE